VNTPLNLEFEEIEEMKIENGKVLYPEQFIEHLKKWVYRMEKSVDNKKYSTDTRAFSDAVNQDKIFEKGKETNGIRFYDSPISARSMIKDVCVYKPGDKNKNGKEGKTSWDSFSYAIQMGHNVWMHINSVQEANRQYDQNVLPAMMSFEHSYRELFRDVIDTIFSADTRENALAIIEHYNRFWLQIIGTRGATGKKTINTSTVYNKKFNEVSTVVIRRDDSGLNNKKLDKLEELIK
jgi:hypothetical protein